MPKDEFDFEDPFELNGMAFLTHEDSTNEMAECFIEEFMRMGYGHKQILALFRNPHYLGPNLAYEKRGESFIRELIAEVFGRWGKAVTWPQADCAVDLPFNSTTTASIVEDDGPIDPFGAPAPKLNLRDCSGGAGEGTASSPRAARAPSDRGDEAVPAPIALPAATRTVTNL